jgi:hypothetical protein
MLRESREYGAVRRMRANHGHSVRIVRRRRKQRAGLLGPFVMDDREVPLSLEAVAMTKKSAA